MQLVADASVLVRLSLEAGGFGLITTAHTLHSPALGRSESQSVLHELQWRGQVTRRLAGAAVAALAAAPLVDVVDDRLLTEAWRVADEAGWAKTYDAEYVAAARLLGVPLLTLDARLQRGAARLVETLSPEQLP